MATKNTSISKRSLMELAGILTKDEADNIKKNIKQRRMQMRQRVNNISLVMNNSMHY